MGTQNENGREAGRQEPDLLDGLLAAGFQPIVLGFDPPEPDYNKDLETIAILESIAEDLHDKRQVYTLIQKQHKGLVFIEGVLEHRPVLAVDLVEALLHAQVAVTERFTALKAALGSGSSSSADQADVPASDSGSPARQEQEAESRPPSESP